MGKLGIFVNIGAVAWLLTVWIFCFFPLVTGKYLTLSYMNWNCLIYGTMMITGLVYWFVVSGVYFPDKHLRDITNIAFQIGRKTYTPPRAHVDRKEL